MPATSKNQRRSRSAQRTAQDATTLLRADHENVRELLEQLDETTSRGARKRLELLNKIALEVRIHSRIEEEIFYPAYREAADTQEETKLFFEAKEEHGLVDFILPSLEKADPTTETFSAKAKVLRDLIEHHADEEEHEMFPKAEELLGSERLEELGAQLAERKEALKAQLGNGSRRARR
jgi:hemerythrin-like domain-containing protein